jgi:hypothetical protein
MYAELLPVRSRAVADYIPQLRRVDPEQLAIAVCTVDGQRFCVGDATIAFCLQSVSKTVSYCLALEQHGVDEVHRHVGREPSGRSFNELALNPQGLPHNPMVNAGAIMTCSLIRPEEDIADRFDHVAATWRRLTGGGRIGFSNAVYLSERQTADRNFALGYSMRERRAFRPGTDLVQTLEFYFQCCSIEVDAQGQMKGRMKGESRYERHDDSARQGSRGPAGRRLAPDRPRLILGGPARLRRRERPGCARLPLRRGRRRQPLPPHHLGRPVRQHPRRPAGRLRRRSSRRADPSGLRALGPLGPGGRGVTGYDIRASDRSTGWPR